MAEDPEFYFSLGAFRRILSGGGAHFAVGAFFLSPEEKAAMVWIFRRFGHRGK